MRAWLLALTLSAGCMFQLQGPPAETGSGAGGTSDNGGGSGGNGSTTGTTGQPPPAQPTGPDAGTPDPTPAPTSPPDMAIPPIGAPCMTDADCGGGGRVCGHDFRDGQVNISVPGGYCTKSCSSGNPCPSGSTCIAFSFGDWCESNCPTPDPCSRTGYDCCKVSEKNVCLPAQLCPKGPGPGGG